MPAVTVFDIKRFAVHDGPGIRTTVFLKGCPLRCSWCHNPESQDPHPVTVEVDRKLNGKILHGKKTYGKVMDTEGVMEVVLRDRTYYEESGGGVTFSGGEPLQQAEALEDMLIRSRREGLHTAVDTCGYVKREKLESILPHTSLFLYDLKNMDPELHRVNTGADPGLVLSNADFLLEQGARVIFRIPVIPGLNTSPGETEAFIAFLDQRSDRLEEVHLLPYHRIAGNKYRRLGMPAPPDSIREPGAGMMDGLRARFETTGLTVRVGG